MEKLICIAFTSSMTSGLTREGRAAMVSNARVKSGNVGISSVLLLCDGSFMQYMEGPESSMQGLYRDIEIDSRHRGLIKLFQQDIAEREFADSAMDYHESIDCGVSPSKVDDWLQPKKAWINPGRTVLSGFWCNNNALRTRH